MQAVRLSDGLARAITYGGRFDDMPVPEARDLVGRLAAYFPEDAIVIDLARFDRLREYVAADEAYWRDTETEAIDEDGSSAVFARFLAARAALLPTDTDPLP